MRSLRPWCALFALAFAAPASALETKAPDPSYLPELVAAAKSKSLAQERAWLRLGHWRAKLLGRWESEADGPALFLSPDGKDDPAAELEATLTGFFAATDPAPAGPLANPLLEHPQCRFPARFAWLAAAIPIDLARLPPRACPRFDAFWKKVSARSAALVFSSYYLTSPASAFGHTFLRLGRGEVAATGERLDLVDQAVDFAAVTNTSNAVLYAFDGLFGLFKGEFTARPYFYKVREYADFESRDLWEYELSLDPRQLGMLVAHLWELGQTWFDYYYVTENCSYHVLSALEAADLDADLLSHVGPATIPADTVKALFLNPSLVREVRFRPSARTQLAARTEGLTSAELDTVETLADRGEAPGLDALPATDQARVVDAALDLVDVRHFRDLVGGVPAVDALRQKLLNTRSAIAVASPPLSIVPPSLGGPERGHASLRLGVGGSASSDDGPGVVLDGRVALHDLADPPAGFSPRTQIEFLKFRLTVPERNPSLRLDEFSLVEVTNLNPIDRFDRHPSWKLRVGATRVEDGGCATCVAGLFSIGGGPGYVSRGGTFSAALTGDADLLAAPSLQGISGTGVRAGVGPGMLLRLLTGERTALVATGTWRYLPWSNPETSYDLSVEGRLHLGPVSLAARWRKAPLAEQGSLVLLWYAR
ncbi:MAG: DUF4105 domain-containing protein [Myxococcales bacterium]